MFYFPRQFFTIVFFTLLNIFLQESAPDFVNYFMFSNNSIIYDSSFCHSMFVPAFFLLVFLFDNQMSRPLTLEVACFTTITDFYFSTALTFWDITHKRNEYKDPIKIALNFHCQKS